MNNPFKMVRQARGTLVEQEKESPKEKPYRLLVLSHDDAEDPNKTGVLIRDKGTKLGLKTMLAEFIGCYTVVEKGQRMVYSFPVDKEGNVPDPDPKETIKYAPPFAINPENTIIMIRGLGTPGISGNRSWFDMARLFEHEGFFVVNSTECHDICFDKWMNQIIFKREKFRTPKTALVAHQEGSLDAFDRLKTQYPIILKTSTGSRGVGVIFVESAKTLQAITQLLYRENTFIDIILQEYILTDYDVRVIVCSGKIIGVMKRPIAKGDFRSNVSQGSEPVPHELTELEKSESLRAAKVVRGVVVGVDFIPAKNREKESPYFIEVNSTPGLIGIEKALDGGGFSITEEILKRFMDRDLWKSQPGL